METETQPDSEAITYEARDGNGGETTFDASSPEEARQAAIDWAREGDWDLDGGTIWVSVTYGPEGCADDEEERVTVAIDPDEPECAEGHEHDWVSPYWLLGGCKENPGVWGNCGGVVITEACRHCGAKKTTDTWAQDPETGRQGLTSVRYEEDVYSDRFRERGEKEADGADIQTEEEAKDSVKDKGELFRAAYLSRMAERRSAEEEG